MVDWRHARLTAAVYDFGIERERLGRLGGRLVWGADLRRFYRDLDRPWTPADGDRLLDVPCGGGIAFRGLRAGQDAEGYVALDLSPVMLHKARSAARRRGLRGVSFVQADATRLPLPDGGFGRCVSYFGLHCFPDPPAALAEMARVLRPGGRLRGTAIVRGGGHRQDAVIRAFQRDGTFGTVGTAGELSRWLAAGFAEIEVERDGAVAHFSARRTAPGAD